MTYGTGHLLIGGVYFQGEGPEKILLCKGGEGHYMKNKNIGGGRGCQLNLVSKKGPNIKMRKNAKKYQTLNNFSSLVLLTQHFTKFIFLVQLIAMPKFNKQNMLLFFLSSHQNANPLLHLYHFRKKV